MYKVVVEVSPRDYHEVAAELAVPDYGGAWIVASCNSVAQTESSSDTFGMAFKVVLAFDCIASECLQAWVVGEPWFLAIDTSGNQVARSECRASRQGTSSSGFILPLAPNDWVTCLPPAEAIAA
ncbi:hypothetical protein ETAA8_09600 [Anatilimnocola aggregata]|uniref:Uncharacterized protein n=1 Tax=Anatilimnocola aggregata TaxID=2528021 RepID=A0A517Y6M5_9BACT|nr:hypothetical protein ETAA8_09600 [Anatilimnocola aggregata]